MKKTTQKPPLSRVEADVLVGLNEAQVDERKKKGYANISSNTGEKTTAGIIFGNLFTFFNSVLFTIAAIFIAFIVYLLSIGRSDIVNDYFGFSKFIFLVPALMNVTVGTSQELHSRKIIKSLRIVTEAKSKVVRGGKIEKIDAGDIVIDDVVDLSAGDQATADLVVLTGEVSVDESMLTGESDHIKKLPGDTVLSGSAVIVGEARARAVAVGDDTYAEKLSKKVKSGARHKSELMTTIMKILKFLTVMIGVVAVTTVTTLVIKISRTGGDASVWDGMTMSLGDPVTWSRIMLTTGSFGVGIIPSGLVLTTSVALMLSVVELSRKKTLIQELYSLENLSRVDVICLDKTGTLTDGTMTVCDVKCFADEEKVKYHIRGLLATVENRNQTAEAIYKRFGAAEGAPYKELIPFSSETKCSGLVYENGQRLLMGAPEYMLPKDDERLGFVAERARDGKRVIALKLDDELLSFFVIEDHIRETAADTLAFFRENGVTVKVISGDNPLTVSKIARDCGVENSDRFISLDGVPLEKIPEIVEDYSIFARVSPEQKEALVTALQARGHKVAMTGDGVNDILALRKADSSITFAKATEAAKSCSDVVLLDNDFSHLKDVVGEGRRVIGNIQKTSVMYLMKGIAVIIMAFALIPFPKGQTWFNLESVYMLEAAVIGTGGFLLSLESRRTPIRGSFISNINLKALAAGFLGSLGVLLPILMYTVPKVPLISEENVRSMMTVLLMVAGLVVVLYMCIPFNKYRTFAFLAVTFVATFLGMMLPTSYIGGRSIGAEMLEYPDGGTIFQSRLLSEMFRPWNSPIVQNIVSDIDNYRLIRVFLFVAIPMFLTLMLAIDRYLDKKNGVLDGPGKNAFIITEQRASTRAGKVFVLVSSIVFVIYAMFSTAELVGDIRAYKAALDAVRGQSTYGAAVAVAASSVLSSVMISALHVAMGVVGYAVWHNGKSKSINAAFVLSIVMGVLLILNLAISRGIEIEGKSAFEIVDAVLILALTAIYIFGIFLVKGNYKKKHVVDVV